MAIKQVKYSTVFFCPECKKKDGAMRMLILDESINLLRCPVHTSYMKQCSCKAKDLIVSGYYDDGTEEEIQEEQQRIEEAPLTTVEEAERATEDRLEEDYARILKEHWGSDVEGF